MLQFLFFLFAFLFLENYVNNYVFRYVVYKYICIAAFVAALIVAVATLLRFSTSQYQFFSTHTLANSAVSTLLLISGLCITILTIQSSEKKSEFQNILVYIMNN